MADFKINVIVDPKPAVSGIDKVDGRLEKTERKAKRLQGSLSRAFTLVGIAATVREIARMADTLTNATNRIRIVTSSTAQLNAVMDQLFQISKQTRSGFEATATIYSRTALAVKNLGLSQQETLNFTKSLNQAIVLSGASAQEANAALIQLSQGLASGTLRGDELRSVLEQLPKVADVIAVQMGVTRGELRLLGAQGKIAAEDIIDAFKSAADSLDKDFASTIPTISQSFSVLTTNIIQYVGEVNKASGISSGFANIVIALSANLATLGKIAIITGAAFAGPLAKAGIGAATRAITLLTVAIAANPIGFMIVAVTAIISALVLFADEISLSADGLVSLGDVAEATFTYLIGAVQPVVDFFVEGFGIISSYVAEVFSGFSVNMDDVFTFAKKWINNIIGLFIGMGFAIRSVLNDLATIINDYFGTDIVEVLSSTIDSLINGAIAGVKGIFDATKQILSFLTSITAEAGKALGIIAEETGNVLSNVDISAIANNPLVVTLGKVGENAKDAFIEGFNQDFVGEIENVVAPALAGVTETITKIMADARSISAQRRSPNPGGDPELDKKGEKSDKLPLALREQLRLLEEERTMLQLVNKERDVQNELMAAEEKLRSSNTVLTESQRELLKSAIALTQQSRLQAEVLDSLIGPYDDILNRQAALVQLYDEGKISLAAMNTEMLNLAISQSELNIQQGEGSFFDGFVVGIDGMLDSVRNFGAEAGMVFASFFEQTSDGFATAIADSIVFGTSIKDSIGSAARSALSSLLGGLIKIGIQYALNAALGQSLAATATAAGVAEAGILASAWAPAATFASLASFGANAAPAAAGIASTTALTQGLAIAGFADGGSVSGAGSSRSDSIPAMLSNGEFVVNAKSAARFRPQLEAMNNPSAPANSGTGSAAVGDQTSSTQQEPSGNNTRIINVIDPSLVDDFLTSSAGEKTIINLIERNASSVNQVLGS